MVRIQRRRYGRCDGCCGHGARSRDQRMAGSRATAQGGSNVTRVQRRSAALAQTVSIVAVAAFAVGMAGCTSFKQSLGAGKTGPDETAIVTRAPLVVPATFDLKPPQPGVDRPQDSD